MTLFLQLGAVLGSLEESAGLSSTALIGVVCAGAAVLIILILVVVLLVCRRRRLQANHTTHPPVHFYADGHYTHTVQWGLKKKSVFFSKMTILTPSWDLLLHNSVQVS